MKLKDYLVLLAAVVLSVGVVFAFRGPQENTSLSGVASEPIGSLNYSLKTVTSTVKLLAAGNSGRRYCILSNTGATSTNFIINATSTAISSSTVKVGTLLAAGASYPISAEDNYLTGHIWAVNTPGNTAEVSVGCN